MAVEDSVLSATTRINKMLSENYAALAMFFIVSTILAFMLFYYAKKVYSTIKTYYANRISTTSQLSDNPLDTSQDNEITTTIGNPSKYFSKNKRKYFQELDKKYAAYNREKAKYIKKDFHTTRDNDQINEDIL